MSLLLLFSADSSTPRPLSFCLCKSHLSTASFSSFIFFSVFLCHNLSHCLFSSPPFAPSRPDETRCSDSAMRRRCLHESGRELFGRTECAALWVVGFLLNSLAQLLSGMSGIVRVCAKKMCRRSHHLCLAAGAVWPNGRPS